MRFVRLNIMRARAYICLCVRTRRTLRKTRYTYIFFNSIYIKKKNFFIRIAAAAAAVAAPTLPGRIV